MKTLFFKILSLVVIAALLSSCSTTHTYIGNYKYLTQDGDTNVCMFSKARQHYVLGGLVELEHRQPEIPPTKNCDIKTQTTALDALVNGFTFGIFEQKTIKVYGVASECNMPEKVYPVIENGLQLEAEAGSHYAVIVSYKYKKLDVGVGFSPYGQISYKDSHYHSRYYDSKLDCSQFFLKGQWRFMNRNVSPVLGGKIGYQNYYESFLDCKSSIFYAIYTGVTVRIAGVHHLTMNTGFRMTPKLSLKDENFSEVKLETRSTPYVVFNYTRTFGFGQGLHEKAMEKARKLMNRENN